MNESVFVENSPGKLVTKQEKRVGGYQQHSSTTLTNISASWHWSVNPDF